MTSPRPDSPEELRQHLLTHHGWLDAVEGVDTMSHGAMLNSHDEDHAYGDTEPLDVPHSHGAPADFAPETRELIRLSYQAAFRDIPTRHNPEAGR